MFLVHILELDVSRYKTTTLFLSGFSSPRSGFKAKESRISVTMSLGQTRLAGFQVLFLRYRGLKYLVTPVNL